MNEQSEEDVGAVEFKCLDCFKYLSDYHGHSAFPELKLSFMHIAMTCSGKIDNPLKLIESNLGTVIVSEDAENEENRAFALFRNIFMNTNKPKPPPPRSSEGDKRKCLEHALNVFAQRESVKRLCSPEDVASLTKRISGACIGICETKRSIGPQTKETTQDVFVIQEAQCTVISDEPDTIVLFALSVIGTKPLDRAVIRQNEGPNLFYLITRPFTIHRCLMHESIDATMSLSVLYDCYVGIPIVNNLFFTSGLRKSHFFLNTVAYTTNPVFNRYEPSVLLNFAENMRTTFCLALDKYSDTIKENLKELCNFYATFNAETTDAQ